MKANGKITSNMFILFSQANVKTNTNGATVRREMGGWSGNFVFSISGNVL